MRKLLQAIQTELLLSGMIGGIYVEDMKDNESISLNPDEVFPSASVVKIPIAVHVMDKVDKKEITFDQVVEMDLSSPEYQQPMGSGVITNLTSKLALNIYDLLMLSVAESDNLATNELLKFVNMADINQTLTTIGLKHTRVTVPIHNFEILRELSSNPTTAKEMGLLLSKIFKQQLPLSDMLINMLCNQKYDKRLPFFLPEFDSDLKIAHKTGSVGTFIHDVGLVMRPQFDYVICVLTQNGSSWLNSSLTIARISLLAYEYFSKKYNNQECK